MAMNGLLTILSLGLFAFYGMGLWSLANSKKKRKGWFYLLFFAPYLLLLIPVTLAMLSQPTLITFFTTNFPLALIMIAILIAYFYLWARSTYNAAGEKEFWWFFFLLMISPLWIVYMATKKRRRKLFGGK